MDLPIWFIAVAVLLATADADPTDQGPQMFTEQQPETKPQKVHKREPKYEMKEVVLYLTPSQIRALEAGQGFNQQQAGQAHLTQLNEQIKEQVENAIKEEAHKLQQEKENQVANIQQQIQLKESKQNKPPKETKEQHPSPENNAPQSLQSDLQKREKFNELPQHFQVIPQLEQHALSNHEPIGPPVAIPHSEHQVAPQLEQHAFSHPEPTRPVPIPHLEHQVAPQLEQHAFSHPEPTRPVPIPHLEHQVAPQLEQHAFSHLEPILPVPIPHLEHQGAPQLQQHGFSHPEQISRPVAIPHLEHQAVHAPPPLPHPEPKLVPTFKAIQPQLEQIAIPQEKTRWRPQNYAYLYFYPQGKPINSDNLNFFYPDSRDAKPQQLLREAFPQHPEISTLPLHPKFQLVPYEYGYQNKLEAQQLLQAQLQEPNLNAHRLQASDLSTYRLEPHQLQIDAQDLWSQKDLEAHYHHFDQARKLEGYHAQTAETIGEHQIAAGRLEAQNSNSPKLIPDLKPPKSEESFVGIQQLEAFHEQQMKEVMEARKLKAHLEAQEREALRLDAQLKAEEHKAEKMRQEQEQLAFLRQLEPKKTQMHSILKPLFQGYNIAESLERLKADFPHDKINLEKGFRPLTYAPEYNDEKYRKEVEKILRRNQIEKQRALETAATIANEPPEIILTKEEVALKQPSVEIVKNVKVSVPTPVFVPVPKPFEVKVPQPYPVPLEIIRPIPIPLVKMEKVEVAKPVPIEVEKRVPVPVTKNVYLSVDKPYFIEKVVPIEIKKKIPVRKPLKLSIIRHVWEA